MYLRKETREFETGSYRAVCFCKDCDSQEIEIIKTCKKCGSHNIGHPTLFDNDKRGMIPETLKKDIYIYRCDKCGKEFDAFEVPNIISLQEGEFVPYEVKEDDEYEIKPDKVFTLKQDLCKDCRQELVNKLNQELDNIAKQENVDSVLNTMIKHTLPLEPKLPTKTILKTSFKKGI